MDRGRLAPPMDQAASHVAAVPTAAALWPTDADRTGQVAPVRDPDGGHRPALPGANVPVWTILDPASPAGLRQQLAALLADLGPTVPVSLPTGTVIDTTAGPVHLDPAAHLSPGVLIEGPAYVGPGATIRQGAWLRPHSWICAGAVVGHATEVKHSLLLPGAKAPHFNYVGDAVLGRGVNLGAGVKLSNLRHDGSEIRVRVGEARHGTGLRKFSALLGENAQLGCNAVANPGVICGVDVQVWPNATVSGIVAAGGRWRHDGGSA